MVRVENVALGVHDGVGGEPCKGDDGNAGDLHGFYSYLNDTSCCCETRSLDFEKYGATIIAKEFGRTIFPLQRIAWRKTTDMFPEFIPMFFAKEREQS